MRRKSRQKKNREIYASKLDDVIYWGLVIFFFLLPLMIFPLTAEMFELPKATLLRLFTLFIIFLWTVRIYQTRSILTRRTFLDIPVLFYSGVAVLVTILSINPIVSIVGGYYRYEGLPTILSYLLIFFAVSNFVRSTQQVKYLLYTFLASALLTSTYGIFQHFGLDFFHLTGEVFELTRSSGTFGNPIFLGAFLVLIIPVALVFLVQAKGVQNKFITLVSVLILVTCLVFTSTRGAWLGLTVSIIVMAIVFVQKGVVRGKRAVLIIFFVVLLMVALLSFLYIPKLRTAPIFYRLVSAFQRGGSVATRLDMWRGTMELVKHRPLVGYGWETFEGVFPKYGTRFLMSVEELPDRPHNQLLYIGSSAGLSGWLIFFWIFTIVLWKATQYLRVTAGFDSRRNRKPTKLISDLEGSWLLLGIVGGIISYFVQEQFSFSLVSVTPVFWAFLGLITVLIGTTKERENHFGMRLVRNPNLRIILILVSLLLLVVGVTFTMSFFIADYKFRVWQGRYTLGIPSDIALNSMETAVRLNPYVSKYRIELIAAYAGQASTTGDPQWTLQAVQIAEDGLAINSRDEALWINLGDLYFYQVKDKSSYQKALQAYGRVLKLHPTSAGARWALGDVYRTMGKYNMAIVELEEAVELVPRHVGVWYSLGMTYEEAGREEEAKAAFQRVLELEPNNEDAIQAMQRLTK